MRLRRLLLALLVVLVWWGLAAAWGEATSGLSIIEFTLCIAPALLVGWVVSRLLPSSNSAQAKSFSSRPPEVHH